MMNETQMSRWVELSQKFIERAQKYGMDFVSRINRDYETWVSTYDPETKQGSSMW